MYWFTVDECRYRCYITPSAVYVVGTEGNQLICKTPMTLRPHLSLNYLLHLFWKLIAIFLPDSSRCTVHRKLYQVVVAMFGAQHGGDLLQVGSVALLLHVTGEGDRDDSLCDVDQIQLVVLLQGLQQTCTPISKIEKHLLLLWVHFENPVFGISGPAVKKQKKQLLSHRR